ncbi:MAG: hypothetical protein QHH10_10135 [Peptococcaceae bacterium]|nr:hypothetical protein [Peptococcaceae bacterium]MDH7525659.1 hypothetical protein [Peptococcaceae bacterium]
MGFFFYNMGVLDGIPSKMRIETDNITVRQFIRHLSATGKPNAADIILDNASRVKPGFLLILNGTNIFDRQGLDTIIPSEGQLLLTVELYGG